VNLLLKNIRWYSAGREHTSDLRLGKGCVVEAGRGLAPHRREHVIDGRGYMALPGLINAHEHLHFNLFPHLGAPPYPNFYAWGHAIYHPEQPPLSDLLRVHSTDRLWWGAYKNLISGVTTVVHHDPYVRRVFENGFPVKVLERYAWAHSLGHGGDVAGAFARRRGRPFILHAAEGVDDVASGEIDALERLGVLAPGTVLVHAMALTPQAVRLLAVRGVRVVWCPSSNLHLYGATAPVAQLRAAGVPVTLGTDSTLSGSPTLFDELRAAHATGLATPEELLAMVTITAATVFDLRDGRGTLEPGAPADLLLLRDAGMPAAQAVLDATPSALMLVLVDGQPRLASPEFAEHLSLAGPNACVGGTPRWLAGSFGPLRRRIARTAGTAALARHPLWRLLREITHQASEVSA
jgi:cytosine/adenosine deaminase-related metal-dependent hydrolase